MDDQQLNCPQCGKEVDDSLTWCPYCGTELGRPAGDPVSAGLETEAGKQTPDPDPASSTADLTRPADGLETPEASKPEPGTPSSTTMVVIGLVVLALLGAGVAAFLLLRGNDDGELSVASMEIGQCWNDPEGFTAGETTEVLDVPQVPCGQPHANEVFAVVDHPLGDSGAYPGTDQVELDSFGLCLDRFESYVGVPFGESPLDIFYIYPTVESWAAGDREIICSLYMMDETLLIGSERDSTRRLSSPAINVSSAGSCADLADLTIGLAQDSIDYFDSLTEAELDALDVLPAEMMPLLKGESLILGRSVDLGCSLDSLNQLVVEGASALTATSDFGRFLADDIAANGFFTGG